MVWTSKWSCSSLRKQMTFMVAWSIPWTDSEFFWVSISSKIFSCGFEKGLKIEHPSSPKKKKLQMWLFPIWFTHLLNKSCSINLHHLGHSHWGIQKFTSQPPVRWHIPGSYFRSIGWCHPWCILRSWRVRVGSRHQGQRLWYQPYVP